MRFFYAKKEQICRHCKTVINYGDEAVVIRWKISNIFIPLVVHTTCYMEWAANSFNKRWQEWKAGAVPRRARKKRGRKFKYASRELAYNMNRLRSLLAYHRRAGNLERADDLGDEIKKLEGGIHG